MTEPSPRPGLCPRVATSPNTEDTLLGQAHVCCARYSPALAGGGGGCPFGSRGVLVFQEIVSFHSPWICSLTTKGRTLDGVTTSPDWVLV